MPFPDSLGGWLRSARILNGWQRLKGVRWRRAQSNREQFRGRWIFAALAARVRDEPDAFYRPGVGVARKARQKLLMPAGRIAGGALRSQRASDDEVGGL